MRSGACADRIAREYLPHDVPPYKTVYDCYAKWEDDGTTETRHDPLCDRGLPSRFQSTSSPVSGVTVTIRRSFRSKALNMPKAVVTLTVLQHVDRL